MPGAICDNQIAKIILHIVWNSNVCKLMTTNMMRVVAFVYPFPIYSRQVKQIQGTVHVSQRGETINMYRILVGKSLAMWTPGRWWIWYTNDELDLGYK